MAVAFDAVTPTGRINPDTGKESFAKCGVAFENKDGGGYTILLDTLPVATLEEYNGKRDIRTKILLRPPWDPKKQGKGNYGGRSKKEDDGGF